MSMILDEKAIIDEFGKNGYQEESVLFHGWLNVSKFIAHAQARAILTAIEEADQSGSTPRQSRIAILRLIRQLEAELREVSDAKQKRTSL